MNMEIANRLVTMRKEAGFSQEELAEKVGVSRQAISNWERGESSPDTDNLIMLAHIYHKTVDEILTGNTLATSTDESEPREVNLSKAQMIWRSFPYPILCTIIYLVLGFCFDWWHPAWIVFLTIPIFYYLVNPQKYDRENDKKEG